jgi:hypothetical protein
MSFGRRALGTASACKRDEKWLAGGDVAMDETRWHKMELSFHGGTIHASIDGKTVADLLDAHPRDDWHRLRINHTGFDNLAVDKVK